MSASSAYSQPTMMQRVARNRKKERQQAQAIPGWEPEYKNSQSGKMFKPHNRDMDIFISDDVPRYLLLKGGEGGGKSVAGIIKTLNRLRRGMNGGMASPDFEHFKKSLWPEFVKWCPWHRVIDRHQYRQQPGWVPGGTFYLTFHVPQEFGGGYSTLICGGAKESEIGGWEGPNLNFFFR